MLRYFAFSLEIFKPLFTGIVEKYLICVYVFLKSERCSVVFLLLFISLQSQSVVMLVLNLGSILFFASRRRNICPWVGDFDKKILPEGKKIVSKKMSKRVNPRGFPIHPPGANH